MCMLWFKAPDKVLYFLWYSISKNYSHRHRSANEFRMCSSRLCHSVLWTCMKVRMRVLDGWLATCATLIQPCFVHGDTDFLLHIGRIIELTNCRTHCPSLYWVASYCWCACWLLLISFFIPILNSFTNPVKWILPILLFCRWWHWKVK